MRCWRPAACPRWSPPSTAAAAASLYTLLRPLARPTRRTAGHARARSPRPRRPRPGVPSGGTYEVLYNGIEVDRFAGVEPWPTTGPAVLFLGRHEERKGLAVLLEAWTRRRATRADPGASTAGSPVLWVAGDGPETDGAPAPVPRVGHAAVAGGGGRGGEGPPPGRRRRPGRARPRGRVVRAGPAGGHGRPHAWWWPATSTATGTRPAAAPCWSPPGDPAALADGAARACWTASLAPDAGVDDGAGLPPVRRRPCRLAGRRRGAGGRWSMASLAGRYEELYRSVVVGSRP